MKLPALAITALFVCGIVVGLYPPFAARTASHLFVLGGFVAAACLILAGLLLMRLQRLLPSAVASMLSWTLLGVLSAGIAGQPLPPDHVIMLVDGSRINLHTPLRWYGRLRDERARLPWGCGYEIELSGVEYQNALLPARGGMRLGFTPHPGEQGLPDLHAGDEIAVLTQAKRPQVFKDDGAFDRRAYLATQNVDLVATLRAPELIERVSVSKPTAAGLLARARRRLRDETDTLFTASPGVAGVLRAMLLGDRSFVDRAEATDFQKTGVFHVLVVAGLHVGALAAFLFWAGRKLRLTPLWTILFTLTLLFAYVAVVEQRPPVLRAALMAAIVVIGGFFYRRLDLLNSAALAALVLLVARPLAIRDSSFQLTFVAIGCIAGLALPWLARTAQPYVRALRGWRDVTRDAAHEPHATQFRIDLRATARWISARVPRRLAVPSENALAGGLALSFRIWELLVLTVVLQIGMLPLMARDFHRIPLAAPLVNLVAVPLTGVVVPLGFLVLGTGLLFPALGGILATPLAWLTLALLHVVQWFAHLPHWSYRIPGPPLWLLVLFFIVAVLLAAAMRVVSSVQRATSIALCAGLIACSVLVALFPFGPKWAAGKLEVTILDVGQGDSLFVVSPRGRTLLIDGGGAFGGFPGHEEHTGIDPGEEAVSPYLWSRGYQKVDVVALTHAHQDHLGGLTAILENFRVGRLWIGREVASPALARLEELAHAKGIPIEHEIRGKSFVWDGVAGQFFWPEISPAEVAPSAKNSDSLVLRLRYGGRTLLLPGDAEKDAERTILSENSEAELRADVLKVGHHGSKNSTMPDFLAAVKPSIAIISAGEDNPYGHPSPQLIDRLDGAQARTLRTDRDGAIRILTDGDGVDVTCFVACRESAANAVASEPIPQRPFVPPREDRGKLGKLKPD
jgi:competence protein ComEC